MKAIIFQHMSSNTPGTLRKVMIEQGIDCQVVNTAYEAIDNQKAHDADVLVVLGGSPGVYQSDDYPFLKQEKQILERRLAADKPTLGICLGAQLMAAALGEKVYKGTQGPEIGWFDLTWLPEADNHSVRAFKGKKIMQWHGDTFDLPKGATLLASSQQYAHQIYSYGRNALAFQCHIEVTADILADWYVHDAGIFVKKPDLHRTLIADTAQYIEQMTSATEIFMKDWLAQALPQAERRHA